MNRSSIRQAGPRSHLPEDLTGRPGTVCLNARRIAEEAGLVKAANMVLLGALAAHLGIELEIWYRVLEELGSAQVSRV